MATFAFAVVIDVMIIRQTEAIKVDFLGIHTEINLFTNGSLTMPRPHWFGIDFLKSQRNYLMLMTVLFVLIGIGLDRLATFGVRTDGRRHARQPGGLRHARPEHHPS